MIQVSSSTAFGRVLRSLRRSPGFVAIATLSMGVALGISTSVFAVMDAMTHPEPPFREPGQLYNVYTWALVTSPPPTDSLRAMVAALDGVERVGAYTARAEVGIIGGRVTDITVGSVGPSALDVLGVRARLGRLITQADFDRSEVALVSDMIWRRDFVNRSRIGDATVQVGDRAFRVIGVMPSGAERATRFDVIVPAAAGRALDAQFVRLRPGVTLNDFQPRLRALNDLLTKQYAGPKDRGFRASIRPLTPDPLRVRDFHRAMVGAAVCILLIACANVAALMLARGLSKKRDYALRLALGARPAEIGREVIVEISLVAAAGCLAGALVTSWFVGLIGRAMPVEMAWQGFVQPQWSWRVLLLAMSAVVASIVVAGGFPAWSAARTDPAGLLKEGAANTTGRVQTRFRWLVIAELAMAMTLLMSTSLMQKSIHLLEEYDFGYPIRQVLQAGVFVPWRYDSTSIDEETQRQQQGLAIVRGVPGVKTATIGYRSRCDAEQEMTGDRGLPPLSLVSNAYRGSGGCTAVGAHFLEVHGLRIVDGRDFAEGDVTGGGGAVLLDEKTAKRLFPGERAVGRTVKLGSPNSPRPWIPVVGVVQNHMLGLDPHPEMGADSGVLVYVAQPQRRWKSATGVPRGSRSLNFLVRVDGDAQQAQLAIMRALTPLAPENGRAGAVPSDVYFQQQLKVEQFLGLVFTCLGLASLLLGAAGLYSVISYVAGQRMREFAVRIALGATRPNVARLVLREAFLMAIGGTAVGAGFGMWGAFLLWERMWGVYPVDAQALVIAESVLVLTTMIACLVPALRASQSDPMTVIRAS